MEKVKECKLLMEEVRKATVAHSKYLGSKRAYLNGEELYMREAHFVMEIGMGVAPTMSELAERLKVTAAAVSQLALRMEQKGYVQRQSIEQDKRVNIVILTEKGKELYKEHEAYDNKRYSYFADILEQYTLDEIQLIKKFEQQIAQMFIK